VTAEVSNDPKQRLWNALLGSEYDEKDGIMQLRDQNLQWLTEPSPNLFIRQCHEGLFNIIQKLSQPQLPEQGIVVTGNSGFGKSWFLLYCLLRLAQEKKTVFFKSSRLGKGWLFKPNGTVTLVHLRELEPYPPELDKPSTYYLFDPYGAPGEPL
jgi:hypothetical protein